MPSNALPITRIFMREQQIVLLYLVTHAYMCKAFPFYAVTEILFSHLDLYTDVMGLHLCTYIVFPF